MKGSFCPNLNKFCMSCVFFQLWEKQSVGLKATSSVALYCCRLLNYTLTSYKYLPWFSLDCFGCTETYKMLIVLPVYSWRNSLNILPHIIASFCRSMRMFALMFLIFVRPMQIPLHIMPIHLPLSWLGTWQRYSNNLFLKFQERIA